MHFTLADLITDITQNACESGAELVELEIKESDSEFRFEVRDNGKGMTGEELSRVVDPFVTDGEKHPHRKIGLGLPFLIQTAEQSGGGWDVQSEKGKGTLASAWFDSENTDTPPTGDLPDMFKTVLMSDGPTEIIIHRKRNGEVPLDYEIRKTQLTDSLGGLEDVESLLLLKKYLHSLEENKE